MDTWLSHITIYYTILMPVSRQSNYKI